MLSLGASSWSQRSQRWPEEWETELISIPHWGGGTSLSAPPPPPPGGRGGAGDTTTAPPPRWTSVTQDKGFITINDCDPMKLYPLKKTDSPSSEL